MANDLLFKTRIKLSTNWQQADNDKTRAEKKQWFAIKSRKSKYYVIYFDITTMITIIIDNANR